MNRNSSFPTRSALLAALALAGTTALAAPKEVTLRVPTMDCATCPITIKAALMKYGVRVVSVTEPIDAKPEGRLLETILAGFAQFDNDVRAGQFQHGTLDDAVFTHRLFGFGGETLEH